MSQKQKFLPFLALPLLAVLGWLLVISRAAQAGEEPSISVTSLADELIWDGNCTLREAILAANNNMVIDGCRAGSGSMQADVITFAVSGTILLNHPDGELVIEEALIIEGNGRTNTILDAQENSRIFLIQDGRAVTLRHLTLQNGATDPTYVNATGGAILNGPVPLFLDDVLVQDSRAEGGFSAGGGGIASLGRLTMIDSEVRNNSADGSYNGGGGILIQDAPLVIQDSIISNNSVENGGGGGGIFILSDLMTVTDSLIENNTADFSEYGGGGIFALGSLSVQSSVIQGNSIDESSGSGGGIYCECLLMEIISSTIRENSAAFALGGGGIAGVSGMGVWQIWNSTISYNSAAFASQGGGGVWLEIGGVDLINSTISLNTADSSGMGGGGILIGPSGGMEIMFSTVANNTAVSAQGGGLYNEGEIEFWNSIFAGNSPFNCLSTGETVTYGFNLSTDTSCELTSPDDLPGVNPLLGDLQDNGGPTETHALPANSPAVDAGECHDALPTDQRGVPRPYGPGCDIGAFEYTPYRLYLPVIVKE
jgi:CSLREA domain-containing protein